MTYRFGHLLRVMIAGAGISLGSALVTKAELPEVDLEETVEFSNLSGSFLAARLATRNNDDIAAVAFYQRALELDPDNDDIKNQLFLSLLANGRIADAVELSTSIPEGGNTENMIRFVAAVDRIRTRSWEKAQARLADINGGDLDGMMVGLLEAWSMFGAGKPADAIKRADELDGPDWIKVVREYHTGLMTAASGDDLEAIVRLGRVIENRAAASVLTQVYVRSIEAMIRAHLRQENWEGAAEILNTGFDLFPNHPPFFDLNTAIIKKESLPPLASTPQQGAAELFFNVGTAIGRNDNTQFSRTYLQIASFLDGKSDVIALAIAETLERQEENARANTFYERISETSPFYRRAQLESALNLNQMGEKEKAVERLRQLVADEPNDLVGSLTLGQVLSIHEDYRGAAEVYDAAVERISEVKPYHWNLFYRRGISYERLKEWETAEPNFKKALELYPDQPDVLNYLGYSWIDMGINIDEGMEMIRKAVELKPQSGFIIDSLGWAYYRQGKYDDAVRELERAVEIMPEDPTINDHLGDAYWKVGRKLEATFQWRHALTGDPDPEQRGKIERKLEVGLIEEDGPAVANE